MVSLSKRLRTHVDTRGGPAIENGAWSMMIEAADVIDALVSALKAIRDLNEAGGDPWGEPGRPTLKQVDAALELAQKEN